MSVSMSMSVCFYLAKMRVFTNPYKPIERLAKGKKLKFFNNISHERLIKRKVKIAKIDSH